MSSRPRLFYTRDSGGKHEMTPGQYVLWAQRQSGFLGVSFAGTPEQLEKMIREKQSAFGDLFIDYDVPGNELSRPGLDALTQEARRDRSVSHIFIPRADRLARPDDIEDGIRLETQLRREIGVTIVHMNRTLGALRKGQKLAIGDFITSAVEYDRAEKDRRDLAQKIIDAQIALARKGYSTGGRAPYGFRRCLVRDDGTPVRLLEDGERVRTRGQHVVWVPGPERELGIRLRILNMLLTMPATQVARKLTEEGVASPDSGRSRTDGGVTHGTSGVWHSTTITGIARHPINGAIMPYGRRSMGDRLRYGFDGPRELEEADFRPDNKPKVVRNRENKIITAKAPFTRLIGQDEHQALVQVLDRRAGTQRGKPRSRTPERNPLGGRIYDMNCAWPMYRSPCDCTFQYVCGAYMQSHGLRCGHNHVDGPTVVRFALTTVRQLVLLPDRLAKLRQRLEAIAREEFDNQRPDHDRAAKVAELESVRTQLARAARNMALAESEVQRKYTGQVVDGLAAREALLVAELAAVDQSTGITFDIKAEVDSAMAGLNRLGKLAVNDGNFALARELFEAANMRVFLRFRDERHGKRRLRKPDGGVLTFGMAPPPIKLYDGVTNRKTVKQMAARSAANAGEDASPKNSNPNFPGSEGNSLGNDSRGDRI